MTKPIIVVKVPCKLLYVIQLKEFLIKCLTSWPYLISEFLVAYITIVASDWPRTFFTPKVFLFSIRNYRCADHMRRYQFEVKKSLILDRACRIFAMSFRDLAFITHSLIYCGIPLLYFKILMLWALL